MRLRLSPRLCFSWTGAEGARAALWCSIQIRMGHRSWFREARCSLLCFVAFELQRAWARSNGGVLSGDATGGGGGGESPMVRIGLLSGLRERNFGALDGVNTGAYDDVWPRDLADPWHEHNGVESVASVCARLRAMVDTLEARHDGEAVVLCAHADVIQIFQCWLGGCDVRCFSSYRFKNGEVRRCDELGECLPCPVPMVSQAGVAA